MFDLENIKEAMLLLAEYGFEIQNKKGGYFSKQDNLGFYHQTCYRSTNASDDKEEALNSFLSESYEQIESNQR